MILCVVPVHSQAQGPVIFTREEEVVDVEVAFSKEEVAVLAVEEPLFVVVNVVGHASTGLQRRT